MEVSNVVTVCVDFIGAVRPGGSDAGTMVVGMIVPLSPVRVVAVVRVVVGIRTNDVVRVVIVVREDGPGGLVVWLVDVISVVRLPIEGCVLAKILSVVAAVAVANVLGVEIYGGICDVVNVVEVLEDSDVGNKSGGAFVYNGVLVVPL